MDDEAMALWPIDSTLREDPSGDQTGGPDYDLQHHGNNGNWVSVKTIRYRAKSVSRRRQKVPHLPPLQLKIP